MMWGALITALLDLVNDEAKRHRLGQMAETDAPAFTYDKVGASRANLFRKKFLQFRESKVRALEKPSSLLHP